MRPGSLHEALAGPALEGDEAAPQGTAGIAMEA